MLPLVLVVHVHTGQEHAVGRVGVNPAQEHDVLLVVDIPHILQALHGAAVGLPHLVGYQKVTDDEPVVTETSPQRAQSLHPPLTVTAGDGEEPVRQVPGHHNTSQAATTLGRLG